MVAQALYNAMLAQTFTNPRFDATKCHWLVLTFECLVGIIRMIVLVNDDALEA